jgi:hypothetical protein
LGTDILTCDPRPGSANQTIPPDRADPIDILARIAFRRAFDILPLR